MRQELPIHLMDGDELPGVGNKLILTCSFLNFVMRLFETKYTVSRFVVETLAAVPESWKIKVAPFLILKYRQKDVHCCNLKMR